VGVQCGAGFPLLKFCHSGHKDTRQIKTCQVLDTWQVLICRVSLYLL
jgi:hypothetical protein